MIGFELGDETSLHIHLERVSGRYVVSFDHVHVYIDIVENSLIGTN